MQEHSKKILLVGLLPVREDLTTPIPWRPKRHYTNKQVILFDEVIKEVAGANNLPYVSLFNEFENKLDLFPDGLHPNDEGHQLIADLVLPKLQKLLKR
jgi:lysophospholipase L1-like esterase